MIESGKNQNNESINTHHIRGSIEIPEPGTIMNELETLVSKDSEVRFIPLGKARPRLTKSYANLNKMKPKEKVEEPKKKPDVEDLHQDLHLALVYKTNHNSQTFSKKVIAVLGCLGDCELFTEKQCQTACKILNLIAQSDASWILTQQFAIDALMKVVNAPNAKSMIKCHIVEDFEARSKYLIFEIG